MVSDCTRERLGAQTGVFPEQKMESLMKTFGKLVFGDTRLHEDPDRQKGGDLAGAATDLRAWIA
jgi:hypothetical protein